MIVLVALILLGIALAVHRPVLRSFGLTFNPGTQDAVAVSGVLIGTLAFLSAYFLTFF